MKKLFMILVFLAMVAGSAQAGDCIEKFSWIPSTSTIEGVPEAVNYRILYGPEIVDEAVGKYPNTQDQGLPDVNADGRMEGKVTGLDCGEATHFVVIAVAANGVRSKYSNRTSVNYPADMPASPTNFRIEGPAIINIIVE